MRLYRAVMLVSSLFIMGCLTASTVPSAEIQQLQAQIGRLEKDNLSLKQRLEVQLEQLGLELKKQREENSSLKQQLETTKEAQARMPTGKEIQAALKNAGFYTGNIDGNIGPRTKEAIQKFQEANNLNPDGAVGSRTWSLLSKYLQEKSE